MANPIWKAFQQDRARLCAQVNHIIKKNYEEHGECCATCKHEKYVQESPYYDYTTCEYDKTIEFGFGEGSKCHRCDKYEFIGYLTEKEK